MTAKRARHAIRATEPGQGPANDDRPVTLGERCHAGEERELGCEPLAASRPGVSTEDGHAGERPVRVEGRRDAEHARVRGPRMRELEGDEREERERGGEATEPFGIREERPRSATSALQQPHGRVRNCAPRRENTPDVPEEHGQEREPQPEEHVDERGREVLARDSRSEELRPERDDQEPCRDRTERDAQRCRSENALQAARDRPPTRPPLQLRPAPERTERDERDDEDDRRGGEEERLRDREIPDSPDPVREEDHGLTVSSAICVPRLSSSTSKRPGIVARNGIRAVPPAVDVLLEVVAVDVDLVRDVGVDDDARRGRPRSRSGERSRPPASRSSP